MSKACISFEAEAEYFFCLRQHFLQGMNVEFSCSMCQFSYDELDYMLVERILTYKLLNLSECHREFGSLDAKIVD